MSASPSFAEALSAWKDINIPELQKTFDTHGLELMESQKESAVSRKVLAERTKEFRKMAAEEKPNEFKGLLKSYQTEIDSLTKRCKSSENAFLMAYKLLADAPDPYPLLNLALDQAIKVSHVESLEKEIARLNQKNRELQSKSDSSITADRERRRAEKRAETLEGKLEEMVQERLNVKENEMRATYEERLMNFEEREKDLTRQVNLTKSQLRDLRTSNETKEAQLLDHSQRQDNETVARLAELDIMMADLERSNSRVAHVERRNEQLRAELEASRSGADPETVQKMKQLQDTIASLESSQDRMSQTLEQQNTASSSHAKEMQTKVDMLSKDLESKEADIESLRRRLMRLTDYDEIKRELEIMKYVEFAALDDLTETVDEISGEEKSGAWAVLNNPANSLETLLAGKNKRLEDAVAELRILHAELQERQLSTEMELNNSRADLLKQVELNDRLEQDLLQIHRSNVDSKSDSSQLSFSELSPDGRTTSDKTLNETQNTISAAPASSAEISILPIVTSQRDRFRQRNGELEEELRKQVTIISQLRSEISSLQSDNLKLYEKLRYTQSYRDEVNNSSSSKLASANPFALASDEMDRYRSRYEESVNPFTAFQTREATRAVQALNPVEAAVFGLARHILGSRRARITFVVYVSTVHLLVFFMAYECSAYECPTSRQGIAYSVHAT